MRQNLDIPPLRFGACLPYFRFS